MLKARKKLTKKELKHDPLLDTLEQGKEFFETHKQKIYGAGIGLVVVVLLGWGWMNNRNSTNNEAMLANTKATLAANMGINENVRAELENVVAEYGSNSNIAQTRLELGSAKLAEDDFTGARVEFEKLAASSDKQTRMAGKLKLAYLSEREGDPAAAAKLYESVAKLDQGLVSDYARLQAGYAYLAANETTKCKAILAELLAAEPVGKFKENVEYLQGKVLEK